MSFDPMDMPSGAQKKATHRGRRSRGFGKPAAKGATDPHAAAQQHAQNAADAKTPAQTHAHLFKALSAMKKVPQAEKAPSAPGIVGSTADFPGFTP